MTTLLPRRSSGKALAKTSSARRLGESSGRKANSLSWATCSQGGAAYQVPSSRTPHPSKSRGQGGPVGDGRLHPAVHDVVEGVLEIVRGLHLGEEAIRGLAGGLALPFHEQGQEALAGGGQGEGLPLQAGEILGRVVALHQDVG